MDGSSETNPASDPFAVPAGFSLVQVLLTSAVFLVGFALPVMAGLHVGGVVSLWDGALWSRSSTEPERLFPDAFQVASQGAHLRLSHAPQLNPGQGKEFLITGWFNLRRMPLPGEKLVLFSKYEGEGKLANGYALGLSRDQESLRPIVFWGSAENGGKWYDFPEISLSPRTWFFVALSYSGERYLGLYYSTRAGHPPTGEAPQESSTWTDELQTLGGYELESPGLPSASAPLVLGAVGERQYRGLIGPLAIYSGEKVSSDVRKTLRGIAKLPRQPAEDDAAESLVLWVPGSVAFSGDVLAETIPAGSQFAAGTRSKGAPQASH